MLSRAVSHSSYSVFKVYCLRKSTRKKMVEGRRVCFLEFERASDSLGTRGGEEN